MEELNLDGFTSFLLRNGNLPTTVKRQVNLLKLLRRNITSWDNTSVESFLASFKVQGKRNGYLNRLIIVYNLYNRFAGIQHPKIKFYKEQPVYKSTMSDDEIEAFLSLPCPTVTQRHRNGKIMTKKTCRIEEWEKWTLFWEVCSFSGLRMNEAAKLVISDVDLGRGVFNIINPTSIKASRVAPIAPHLIPKLDSYVKGLNGELLFATPQTGKPLTSSGWKKNFDNRITRLQIKRSKLTPYSLRHSLLTTLLEQDVSLFKVQAIAGHKNVSTTVQYVHMSTKSITEAIKKHPLIRKTLDPPSLLRAFVEVYNHMFGGDSRFEKTITETEDELIIRIKRKK